MTNTNVTEISEATDLKDILLALKLDMQGDQLASFRNAIIALYAQLDPSSVTMTTTNIPDAITKLTSTLRLMNEASQKVFDLIQKQDQICNQLSMLAEQIKKEALSSDLSGLVLAQLAEDQKSASYQIRALGHQVIMAHEFEDLCGQSVAKVRNLIGGLENDLRGLLTALGIAPPPIHAGSSSDCDLNQSETDDLLG
jgi:chemotaxis regulatin CheY-phosphate phosphatase CheZ